MYVTYNGVQLSCECILVCVSTPKAITCFTVNNLLNNPVSLSLSMVILNSRDWSEIVWLLENFLL